MSAPGPPYALAARLFHWRSIRRALLCGPHSKPSPPAPLPWGVVGSMLHKKQKALTKPRPHPRPLSHGERGACFIKNKKPSPKPRPHPRPLSHGERGACFTKNKKPTPKPTKGSGKTRKAKPHHLMNCERAVRHRRATLSQFGGGGGTSSPHKKKNWPLHNGCFF